jgi:hypothetical protein
MTTSRFTYLTVAQCPSEKTAPPLLHPITHRSIVLSTMNSPSPSSKTTTSHAFDFDQRKENPINSKAPHALPNAVSQQSLIFTRGRTQNSEEQAPRSEYQITNDNVLILVEPITWVAIAALFLSKFASSAGESSGKIVGEALGNWIAERLGLGAYTSQGQFEQYLNEIVRRFSVVVREELIEHEIRILNAELAGLSISFQQQMEARKSQTVDVMNSLNNRANELYSGFLLKGPICLIGLMRAGCIRITACACLYDLTDDEGWSKNTINSINEIISDIDLLLKKIERNYSSRVGRYLDENSVRCRNIGKDISEYDDMPVFSTIVTVDGKAFSFHHEGDPCKGRSKAEPVPQEALDKESVAKALIAGEFHNQFTIPCEILKKLAEEARKSVSRIASASNSFAQLGKKQ